MPVLSGIAGIRARPRGRIALSLALSVAALCAGAPADAAPTTGRTHEYNLKSVFLFQFANFVTWPAGAFRDESTPITIGILGDDPFGAAIDEVVSGESVGTRRLEVRRYQSIDQVERCHILFVSASEADHLPAILASLRGRNVLTVGDTKDFVAQGGVVGFTVGRNRLKLRVNLAAADSAQLTISSKLLRQADVVRKVPKR